MANSFVGPEKRKGLPHHPNCRLRKPKVRLTTRRQIQVLVLHILFNQIRAESHGSDYGFDIELFGEVVVENSKWNTKGRTIIVSLAKKDESAEYWPRITKDKTKNPHI